MDKIVIAISTRNRNEYAKALYESIFKYTNANYDAFIVDDASDIPCKIAKYRFENNVGISTVKNKCLEIACDLGAEHIFLLDDDCLIINKGWLFPYINSGEHHLSTSFYKPYKTDGDLNVYRSGHGYCQYFTKQCIDTVGGFDTRYNNKYEHTDLSRRIYNSGLTKYMFQDVIGSKNFIYSLDEHNEIQRSFSERQMQDNLKSGASLFNKNSNSKEFIDFKTK